MLYRFAIVCVFFCCAACNDNEKTIDPKTYDASKQAVIASEKAAPLKFLWVDYKKKRINLWGQTVIKGMIFNNAVTTSYKDVKLKLLYYDKTGKEIRHHEDDFDEVIKPQQSHKFKSRFRVPPGADSCVVSVIAAKIAE